MHAATSALAIKRQRKRLDEQRRAKERRYSQQSLESGLTSPRGSQMSLDRHGRRSHRAFHRTTHPADTKVSSIGMLHIGVVFLVLGTFLIGSGVLPGDFAAWRAIGERGWWNELVISGLGSWALGLFLVVLNRYMSRKEDEDLEQYVQSQLTRSRSGHRLERDAETGGMVTKHTRREKQQQQQRDDEERRLSEAEPQQQQHGHHGHHHGHHGQHQTPPATPRSPPSAQPHGFFNPAEEEALAAGCGDDVPHQLDQIVEEQEYSASDAESRRLEFFNKDTYTNYSSTDRAAADARELLPNGRHMIISRM